MQLIVYTKKKKDRKISSRGFCVAGKFGCPVINLGVINQKKSCPASQWRTEKLLPERIFVGKK